MTLEKLKSQSVGSRCLGDGFMKMEKRKIGIAKEIEKMGMDTKMRRTQLILESQRQMIEAL
ncbi:trihelix protein [Artemisia annua]|uniref:Trihelix protein n=1 Tax=Artemisia annua TaxID=35608 RepID=A0A2U1MKV7_ARTAN|nr:trihelix protein [Artemisia annua]